MVDVDKCERCFEIAKSWYGKPWSVLTKLYAESATFRAEWAEALKNKEAEIRNWQANLGVNAMKRTGCQLEMLYFFLTISEFIKKYSLEPKSIGYKTTKLLDEFGVQELTGCLVKPTQGECMFQYRLVRLFSEQSWNMHEQLLMPQDRLREKEPQETFMTLNMQKRTQHKEFNTYIGIFYTC